MIGPAKYVGVYDIIFLLMYFDNFTINIAL